MNTVEDLARELINRLKRPTSAFNRVCAFHVTDKDQTIIIDATSEDKEQIKQIESGRALVTLTADFSLFSAYLDKTPNMMVLGAHISTKKLEITGEDSNKAIKAGFVLLQSL